MSPRLILDLRHARIPARLISVFSLLSSKELTIEPGRHEFEFDVVDAPEAFIKALHALQEHKDISIPPGFNSSQLPLGAVIRTASGEVMP